MEQLNFLQKKIILLAQQPINKHSTLTNTYKYDGVKNVDTFYKFYFQFTVFTYKQVTRGEPS